MASPKSILTAPSLRVGNPDGDDKPNKKYYGKIFRQCRLSESIANMVLDPRVWVREGEKTVCVLTSVFIISLTSFIDDSAHQDRPG